MSVWLRAAVAAAVGPLAGAIALVGAFSIHPALTLEMDRDLPRMAFGFYPPEVTSTESFAWTSERAQLNLVDFNRRSAWRCSVVFRGGRPADGSQPTVVLALDGVSAASKIATNDYQTIEAVAPARAEHRGLNVSIVSTPTFVPGPADPRALGVQVDRFSCAPSSSG